MPTYEFRCSSGHAFDQFHKMSDAPSTASCPACGADAERAISGGAGFVFKGSGFYLTDYGKNAHRGEPAPKTGEANGAGEAKGGESKGPDGTGSDGKGVEAKGDGTRDTKAKKADASSGAAAASGGSSTAAGAGTSGGAAPKPGGSSAGGGSKASE